MGNYDHHLCNFWGVIPVHPLCMKPYYIPTPASPSLPPSLPPHLRGELTLLQVGDVLSIDDLIVLRGDRTEWLHDMDRVPAAQANVRSVAA